MTSHASYIFLFFSFALECTVLVYTTNDDLQVISKLINHKNMVISMLENEDIFCRH